MRHQAIEFLIALLTDGSMRAVDIAALASERRIKWRTLRRASDELRLLKRPGPDINWDWALPTSNESYLSKLSRSHMKLEPAPRTAVNPTARSTQERWKLFVQSRQSQDG